jgi:hypothetical protein
MSIQTRLISRRVHHERTRRSVAGRSSVASARPVALQNSRLRRRRDNRHCRPRPCSDRPRRISCRFALERVRNTVGQSAATARVFAPGCGFRNSPRGQRFAWLCRSRSEGCAVLSFSPSLDLSRSPQIWNDKKWVRKTTLPVRMIIKSLCVIASKAKRPRLEVSNCGLVWTASLCSQ